MIKFTIPYEHVLMRMGANKYKTKIDTKTEETILESIDFVNKIIMPKYTVSFCERKIVDNKIILSDDISIASKDIIKLTDNCDVIYGFAVTMGKALDDKISSLAESKDVLKSYIFDAIGSVAVEEAADIICNDIKKQYSFMTTRFSAGYGDWPIANQKDFLKWLGAEKIGITLLKSFQMVPGKSVSAVFGVKK